MDNKIRRRKVSINEKQDNNKRKNIKQTENKKEFEYKKRKPTKKTKLKRLIRNTFKLISVFFIISSILVSFSLFGVYKKIVNDSLIIDNNYLKEFYVSQKIANTEEIPQYLKDAVVSIEDERFYEHRGVDIISLVRAVLHNMRYDTTQGGSTIEMQLSKNLLTTMDKTIERKIKDIYNAIKMNESMTKDEILTAYLNNIYLGKSAYGVSSGAEVYFGKEVSDLTLGECAMLAGITNNPGKYKEFTQAKSRQEIILKKMNELGYISDEEYKEAKYEKVAFKSEIE